MDEYDNPISAEYVKEALEEYSDLIKYLNDWDEGVFSVTRQEYNDIPANLIEAYKMYRVEKNNFLKEKSKKNHGT